ncbi:putative enzyme related to lactoylglutathione lyase [Hamadaea flava]|uniref:VOC family protein n=1 Tax=Hamadaea flava TaxID=1742688 RepID=A0ABV8LSN4_9ACTN|nr:VOC family protein [Hamadaea flava]MCP2327218.1 putative enzyme related to lactoylglutathione lyase [Hamadaea flava]
MPKIRNVSFDCADPYALARFWAEVMHTQLDSDHQPDDEETAIQPPDGPALYFQRVPEPKSVKNRVHVCLTPEIRRDAEVERILGLGATLVADHRRPDGLGWAVLADPEGNEFCVLRSEEERAAA